MYHCRLQGKQKAVFVFDTKRVFILFKDGMVWRFKDASSRKEHGPYETREIAIKEMEKENGSV